MVLKILRVGFLTIKDTNQHLEPRDQTKLLGMLGINVLCLSYKRFKNYVILRFLTPLIILKV